MTRHAALGLALFLGGCEFPGAYVCGRDAPCGAGAACDEATGRCLSMSDMRSDAKPASETDASADTSASISDAVSTDGGLGALCHRLCPSPGRCEALVPVGDPSFELDDGHWTFQAPSGRVTSAEDFGRPYEGDWMAELRLDYDLEVRRTFVRLEQALEVPELPPGRYRICFRRRVVASEGGDCPGFPGASHSFSLTGRAPPPNAGEPVTTNVWEQQDDAWCQETEVDKGIRRSGWHETCVEYAPTEPWADPGLLFITRLEGYLTPDYFHTLLLDDVRLHAVDCMTWR